MPWQSLLLSSLLSSLLLLHSPAAPTANPAPPAPTAAAAPAHLDVVGEVPHPLHLTAEDLARLPRTSVQAKDHDGKAAAYSGVTLAEVLKLAGAPAGVEIRGPVLAEYVVVSAADGYRAVFALPELSAEFTDAVVLLADRRDGKPLAAAEGPLRLVVTADKRQARWVRQVLSLALRSAPQP